MKSETLKRRIAAANGSLDAALVLKNARVVNVFTDELTPCDIAVEDGVIVGLGDYRGREEVDLGGKIVCPGLIDGHIHIESSMLCGPAFAQAVVPHGTTAVITDPHEIANVAGVQGIRFMLETTKGLDADIYFMLPSCVPATGLDESGATLLAADLKPFYEEERVLGLAELMDFYGAVAGDDAICDKIMDAQAAHKRIDGHAPFLSGKALNAYMAAGVTSDHECSCLNEALEKLRGGQEIMIREGTAAHNLKALLPLFAAPYNRRCMLVTDDRHPGDLLRGGHIDAIIREAVALGADPLAAIRMGSLNAAQYWGLTGLGAVAAGYKADFLVLSDLERFTVESVYKGGRLVAQNGVAVRRPAPLPDAADYPRVFDSFHLKECRAADFAIKDTGETKQRVIQLTPGELLTAERVIPLLHSPGYPLGVDPAQDVVKLAVCERHGGSGRIGLGFLGGYGLRAGAVASSVAHDSHNLIIAGVQDADMALAANTVRQNGGGLAFVADGRVLGALPLPVAGLMSGQSAAEVDVLLEALKAQTHRYGIGQDIDAFMTLGFASLPVIPKLRLNTLGVIDVDAQKVVPAIF